jgi:hypothetical protein
MVINSVAEPHNFYAAPAPGMNFDAALSPAPILLYCTSRQNFQKELYFKLCLIPFVGAGAPLRYGFGSYQMMRLRLRNTGFNYV